MTSVLRNLCNKDVNVKITQNPKVSITDRFHCIHILDAVNRVMLTIDEEQWPSPSDNVDKSFRKTLWTKSG